MQKFIAVCAFFAAIAVVCSVEVEPKQPFVPILKSESNHNDDGSYNFMYEAGDGTFREETIAIVNPGTDDETIKVTGSYKYIDADGQEVHVEYTADENGFVPVGSHISKQISELAAAAKNLPNEEVKEPTAHH